MQQKNSSILFTLLSSVGMMMLVSLAFHFPMTPGKAALTSSFFAPYKNSHQITFEGVNYGSIDPATMSYFPR